MDFKLFEEGINTLKNMMKEEDDINNFFRDKCDDFIYIPNSKIKSYIANTLWSWSKVEDAQETLEYFIWEMNFGEKWREYYIECNGKFIDITTPKTLYSYLKGNTIYLNEDKKKELKI